MKKEFRIPPYIWLGVFLVTLVVTTLALIQR